MNKTTTIVLALLVSLGVAIISLGLFYPSTKVAAETTALPERALGDPKAPITITEYSSLTCSHCADFYVKVMPELQKRYIDTGKVRFVYRDFPMDGIGLKGAALAHCMPAEQFFPYIKIVYANQTSWIRTDKPDVTLTQYAQMAGLPADKAKACLDDTKLLDALVAVRTEATDKFDIKATPTFIFSDNETKLVGARSIDDFAVVIDKILAKKK